MTLDQLRAALDAATSTQERAALADALDIALFQRRLYGDDFESRIRTTTEEGAVRLTIQG